jgi:hypothetical protein
MDKLVAVIATAHLDDGGSCVLFIAQGPGLAGFDRDKWLNEPIGPEWRTICSFKNRQESLRFLHIGSVSFTDVSI